MAEFKMSMNKLLQILAFLCFVLAVLGVTIAALNMIALGLALWVLASLV